MSRASFHAQRPVWQTSPTLQVVSTGAKVQRPAAHVPGAVKARRVVALTQVAAGGVAQVTPRQGSPAQAPFAQPNAHARSCGAYAQEPPLQVPDAWNVRSVEASKHVEAGGVEQVTPRHGSPAQAPLAQPKGHPTSRGR
ncbi:MAG: hypothetical protein Q8S33_31500 [Myxococcales bacterium]|nr:hypothetical protein [Myxococcales bacterium]